jgi:hypothetical protein
MSSFEPIDLSSGRKEPATTLTPKMKRSIWMMSAILALVMSGVTQVVTLVKGCQATDVAESSKKATETVDARVEGLQKSTGRVTEELASRDSPQVDALNALIVRMGLLERLVLAESSVRGAAAYRAKKKPELKPVKSPAKVSAVTAEPPATMTVPPEGEAPQ